MPPILWIFLLFLAVTNTEITKPNEIEQLIQELRKEPLHEPMWMIHEAGNVLDETWKPVTQDTGKFLVLNFMRYPQKLRFKFHIQQDLAYHGFIFK